MIEIKRKALKDLNKDELLTFIYNSVQDYDNNSINIFDELAGCFSCGKGYPDAKYGYECKECQDE